jgi:hypothetical protein
MQIFGLDSIRSELQSGGYVVKLLANDQAVVFFPRTSEHRDMKVHGLDYEDDSKGNALAAMMSPGRIEFRLHRTFSDARVRQIGIEIIKHPDLAFARDFQITYQGRTLA